MRLFRLLRRVLGRGSRAQDEPRAFTIDTPQGPVAATETRGPSSEQTIVSVTGETLDWLRSLDAEGPEFLARYAPQTGPSDLDDYDRAFQGWLADGASQYSVERVVQIVGGFLGNKCVADFGMEWVELTDEYGTDLAVRCVSPEVVSFPFSTVLKRIESREHGFVHGVYYAIKDTLEQRRAEESP